jgi:predicted MFS family arabinose efflux permease
MPTLPSLLLRVFAPFAAGYFLSFLFRAVNAVLAPELLRDLGMGPSALGLLTATYFIAFASFQLPLGVLLDRFGPRRVEAALLLLAALGAFCFARAETITQLIVGRALIGLGVSACLMAAFKAYTQWFAAEKWPLINGFQMAAGGLGALAATSPVQWLLPWAGWRGIFLTLALCTLSVAALVFFLVPDKETAVQGERFADQMRGIGTIYTSLDFWRVAPLTGLSQATLFAIQGLWASPWLKDVNHLDPAAVVTMLMWIALAMVSGFVGLGALAGRLQRLGIPVLVSAVIGMVLFMAVQLLLLVGPAEWAMPLWLGFGFFGTSGILSYAALAQSFPVHLSGRVSTAVNLLVFVAAFSGQWAIGVIVGWWPQAAQGQFAAAGLRTGFAFMLVCQVAALGWLLLAGRRIR